MYDLDVINITTYVGSLKKGSPKTGMLDWVGQNSSQHRFISKREMRLSHYV